MNSFGIFILIRLSSETTEFADGLAEMGVDLETWQTAILRLLVDCGSCFLLIELIQYCFFMFRIVVLTTGCHSLIVCLCIMFVCCCPMLSIDGAPQCEADEFI